MGSTKGPIPYDRHGVQDLALSVPYPIVFNGFLFRDRRGGGCSLVVHKILPSREVPVVWVPSCRDPTSLTDHRISPQPPPRRKNLTARHQVRPGAQPVGFLIYLPFELYPPNFREYICHRWTGHPFKGDPFHLRITGFLLSHHLRGRTSLPDTRSGLVPSQLDSLIN